MTTGSGHVEAQPVTSKVVGDPWKGLNTRPPLSNAWAKRGDALELTITVPKMTAKRTAHLPTRLFFGAFLSLREATGRRRRETMTSYSLIYLTWGLRKHNNDHSYPFFDHCDINMATQIGSISAISGLRIASLLFSGEAI
jgi:hypothetical protein